MLQLPTILVTFALLIFNFDIQSASAGTSFVYGGCSEARYTAGTSYDVNVKSLFTSLENEAAIANYYNLTVTTENNLVYGLFQCVGYLNNSLCKDCVASSLSLLKTKCPLATGGVIQLQGCFVKYQNTSFSGVLDSTMMSITIESKKDDDHVAKTQAITLGVVAAIVLLIVCINSIRKRIKEADDE